MDAITASSRIFVNGLPPTFTEAEFRKHFSSQREITDAKIFPNRRIGYVGYKTPDDAQKAVKYFNRTFIRMSKIGVEIARPVQDEKSFRQGRSVPTARRGSSDHDETQDGNELKRKRDDNQKKEDDPKLKEFLDAMKPKSKKNAWESEEQPAELQSLAMESGDLKVQVEANQSDDEYEQVPKKVKRRKSASEASNARVEGAEEAPNKLLENETDEPKPEAGTEGPSGDQPAVSDSDWARSRTSRLLGLLDDEEEDQATADRNQREVADDSEDDKEPEKGISKVQEIKEPESSMPTPPSDPQDDSTLALADSKVDAVRSSMRLFVRNLPYDVKDSDLEAEFEPFRNLEEVRRNSLFYLLL
jgi:multiple RNA-binding domain-containing protein 1